MTTDQPTPRELDCLRAYALTGDYQQAADRLGITRGQLVGIFARWRRREGVTATVTLLYRWRDRMVA